MNGPLKYVVGALTFVPLLTVVYTLVGMLWMVVDNAGGGSVSPGALQDGIFQAIGAQAVGLLVTVLLLGFFLWHLLVKRAGEDPTTRVLWVVALFLAGAVTMPLYWYLEFVEGPARRAAAAGAETGAIATQP